MLSLANLKVEHKNYESQSAKLYHSNPRCSIASKGLYAGVTGYLYAGVTGQSYTRELQAKQLLYAGVTGGIYTPELQVNDCKLRQSMIKNWLVQKFDAGVTGQSYTRELQAKGFLYAGVTG
ncbi:hypothetical protein C7B82_27885 [Stenomitos frigidus ULC18]|uniref:Uncharacterized protein n=1 Tax=Stenomitos frigidus ULC18 TaxID=2107698 RepID=A0A2T1DUN6_9CYAN|nr:hypothetical protein C7B82_27885 [Stenomitos frigidus ULC18]